MPLAALMLDRIPEPWLPVMATCQRPPSARVTMPRWYSVRPGFLRSGVVDYLVKPVEGEKLRTAVARAMEQRELAQL